MSLGKDPIHTRFIEQRKQARQRGIQWDLPYWEWLQIWQDSGQLADRGRKGGQWVMGRNGDRGPYAADNVKIIRCETNNSGAFYAAKARRNK